MHNLFSVLPSALETGEGASSLPLAFPAFGGGCAKFLVQETGAEVCQTGAGFRESL